jgi:hypothetical protein
MDEYISREAVNDLIEDIRNNHFILMSDRVTLLLLKSKVAEIPTADVQPVISGDNCIVCGRNVHKDDVYYDVNGGTICEACMNTKCKCKNGR